MYKVAFVTGSRADYGIVRRYLSALNGDSEIALSLLLTGTTLDVHYGALLDLIKQDGIQIACSIKIPLQNQFTADTIHAMAVALDQFGQFFQVNHYDLLIILGDRYEVFSVAIAAAMQRIKILHLHGGEITYANYDEFIRHSITKMSWYHITSTEQYRQRVIQLGEQPENVFCGGALGAENCLTIHMDNVPAGIRAAKGSDYFVVLFHPETMNPIAPEEQVSQLLRGIIDLGTNIKLFFIGSNADTGANRIDEMIRGFCKQHGQAAYYVNLHPDAYHYLVKNAIALVGNSSSGIIEAPSLGIRTINIGLRQAGRVRGKSIVDVACEAEKIHQVLSDALYERERYNPFDNPYYRENSCQLYLKITKELLERKNEGFAKMFYDIV